MARAATNKLEIPEAYKGLLRPSRYKVYYGGRGAGKSHAFARVLVLKAMEKKIRVLCAREFQSSINDSVMSLLKYQIDDIGAQDYFTIKKNEILSTIGSQFIFKGLHHSITEIKSTEGIDYCWVEEAQSVSEESWKVLIPTIRKPGSEIWISFNPLNENDPTYQRFIVNPQPDSIVAKVRYDDNPFFPEVLDKERLHMMRTDPDAYQHVWEGDVLHISDAVVFKGKFEVAQFETPKQARFYHGVDWGFAQDPTCMIRSYVIGNYLYIDREAWGLQTDLGDIPDLFNEIETSRYWPIKADPARPEHISYLKRRGFDIDKARRAGQGPHPIEEGIKFLRSFDRIYIHPSCVHTLENFRLYSFKIEKSSGRILPIPIDMHNHAIDALRYSMDDEIRRSRGFKIHTSRAVGFYG